VDSYRRGETRRELRMRDGGDEERRERLRCWLRRHCRQTKDERESWARALRIPTGKEAIVAGWPESMAEGVVLSRICVGKLRFGLWRYRMISSLQGSRKPHPSCRESSHMRLNFVCHSHPVEHFRSKMEQFGGITPVLYVRFFRSVIIARLSGNETMARAFLSSQLKIGRSQTLKWGSFTFVAH
jgi:hypothetical protein